MYYTLAAEDESSDAHMILGYRYFKGVSVPRSCSKALQHYRLAAEAGAYAALTAAASVAAVANHHAARQHWPAH